MKCARCGLEIPVAEEWPLNGENYCSHACMVRGKDIPFKNIRIDGELEGVADVNCQNCVHKDVCVMLKAVTQQNTEFPEFFGWPESIGAICRHRLEPMPKTWVGVEAFGGIVTDVHLFYTEEEAERWFENYTGLQYSEISMEALTQTKLDQTKLFEVENARKT